MEAVIRFESLSKTYRSGDVDVRAVRDVSFTVEAGEFVAIMGASGSGKSTMMNILGCLDQPTEGRYRLDGIDVSRLGRDALADIRNQKIGFVFQNFNLLARTSARENVELPLIYARPQRTVAEVRDRALESLRSVGLGERAEHHPNQLSGGQQQRVAIARALVNRPALLLADEPTGNLDTRTSVEIIETFQGLNDRGMTIVMVTHEADIARYTKRNIVMRDGVILSDVAVLDRVFAGDELRRMDDETSNSSTVRCPLPPFFESPFEHSFEIKCGAGSRCWGSLLGWGR